MKAIGDANDAKALAEGIIKQKDVQGVASQSPSLFLRMLCSV